MTNVDPYAISPAWEKNKDFAEPFDYVLEDIYEEAEDGTKKLVRTRGQKLFVRRLDMPALLKLGIANEMDFMTKSLVNSEKPEQSAQDAVKEAISMAENFGKMENMVNKICLAGILRPKIHDIPTITETKNGVATTKPNDAARQKGLFYIDNIPWDDRQELFSVIFDSQGLSDFREEQDDAVGNVADVQNVQLPPDGPVAVRPEESQGVLLQ